MGAGVEGHNTGTFHVVFPGDYRTHRPSPQQIASYRWFMAHGHTGLIMKLDRQCKVLGASGGPGKALHRYGEAHFIACDQRDDIYVADTLNWRVQKLVKK